MVIVEQNERYNVIIEFQDEYKIQKRVLYKNFLSGKVKNPYDKSIYGEGFLGEGASTKRGNKTVKEYRIWFDIIRRCYSCEDKSTFVAYKNCVVSDEWKNYSNFYKWYKENLYECSDELEVDKDILSEGKKIYSKETCILIPKKINRFCQTSNCLDYYITCNKMWSTWIHYKTKHVHIGTFESFEDAKKEFLKYKNKIYQELVEKYKEELPPDVYTKLKTSRLVA